ncbi:NAD-dependent epimerase/dehydratase family protein [Campylobacterota bacterium DY0563]
MYLNLEESNSFNWKYIDKDTIIYFLASISSPDICSKEYSYAYNINVTGTKEFIKRLLKIGAKVVFFSSDTVYGEREEPVNEQSSISPLGKYALMKSIIEKEFISSPNFKVFRLSYVFSKNDKFTKFLLESSQTNKEIEIFRPFDRAVVYIEDLIVAMDNVVTLWDTVGSIVNVCGPRLISKKDLVCYFNKYSSNLVKYTIVTPEDSFFKNRPKVINVKSDFF